MKRSLLIIYLILLFVPLYWLVSMSFKGEAELNGTLTFFPADPTLDNYRHIFSDSKIWFAFIDQMAYALINTLLSVSVALPAAYAFSRYRFLGDKHLFFWLLSNRMAPAMIFALPFSYLYGQIGFKDTYWAVVLAHTLFNIPLAVWILEGFMSGIPTAIDETAYIEGYSFPRFFLKIFLPLIAPGIGVACFFCFMYSWIEQVLAMGVTDFNVSPVARQLDKGITPSGIQYGYIAAFGTLSILPGLAVLWFVRNHIARGFALGRV